MRGQLMFSVSDRIDPHNYDRPISDARKALLDQVESISTKLSDHGESWMTTVVLRVPFGTTDSTILSICSQVGVETSARVIRSSYDCTGKSFGGPAEIERGVVRKCWSGRRDQSVIVRVSRSLDV